MSDEELSFSISLPAQMFYIPLFREFISNTISISNFDDKFAYQSAIIVDELCNNAIMYGSKSHTARITVNLTIYDNWIKIDVIDDGENSEAVEKLISSVSSITKSEEKKKHMGLEIVKLLSNSIDVKVDDATKQTVVSVTKEGFSV